MRPQRFPDLVAFAAFGQAFRIAGVIGQHFLGPVTGGKLDQEHRAAAQRPIGARRHAGMGQKLAVKNRFAFKAGAVTDIHHLVVARQQGSGGAGAPAPAAAIAAGARWA